jgi:hypothetical protein
MHRRLVHRAGLGGVSSACLHEGLLRLRPAGDVEQLCLLDPVQPEGPAWSLEAADPVQPEGPSIRANGRQATPSPSGPPTDCSSRPRSPWEVRAVCLRVWGVGISLLVCGFCARGGIPLIRPCGPPSPRGGEEQVGARLLFLSLSGRGWIGRSPRRVRGCQDCTQCLGCGRWAPGQARGDRRWVGLDRVTNAMRHPPHSGSACALPSAGSCGEEWGGGWAAEC